MSGRDVKFEDALIEAHATATFSLVAAGHTLALAVAENPDLLDVRGIEDALETCRTALLEDERASPLRSGFVRIYRQKIEDILYTGERIL